ncbi:hypothetical protein LOTGIDRAFT_156753 [Lottia gigantea]|uniref:TIR domain-containing protein n=1 Tax=Lottia gigantea TaxID=225164 RepID=V4B5I0_LOTGI|nr:hypothetical protein LOTGIDRAFT_156753 [Lottia gigantea]ESP02806.1 hypothetical protein LOTGIDRAFT_156753 [Lottia gigantea]
MEFRYNIIILFMFTVLFFVIRSQGPTACVYEDKYGSRRPICLCFTGVVNCSGQNLTYIPKIPNNTQTLDLSVNSIRRLDINSFEEISIGSPNLVKLYVFKNRISSVDRKCLHKLKALTTLDASFNNARNPTLIANLTDGIATTLENLLLESMDLTTILPNVSKNLEQSNLNKLSFKNNSIQQVDFHIFNLKRLKRLDLSYNSLRSINISLSTSLNSLSLSSNHLTGLPVCCDRRPGLPSLEAIYLDNNCIRKLDMKRINCLSNLKMLNISNTQIERIPTKAFYYLRSLQAVTIEKTESLTQVERNAFESQSLINIYISKNHMLFDYQYIDNATMFQNVPALTRLDLSYNEMKHMEQIHWSNMLCNATGITYLDVSKTGLYYAPFAFTECLLNLTFLSMAGNWIRYLPPQYFVPLKSLTHLDLNENKLAVFSALDFPPTFVHHLSLLDLRFNPFICDCKIIFFLKFAKMYKKIMVGYPKNFECYNGTVITKVANVFTQKSCLLQTEVSEIINCTSFSVILMVVLTSAIYRYRWKLRYILFVLKFQRRKCTNTNNVSHVHDVYVSSADEDFDIVYRQLVSELENKGLNVFFPYRDARPGTIAIRESLEHLDSSKYVLLCVSNAYAQDNWCEFEACMALERSIYEQGEDDIIVAIILEEIDSNNVTKIIDKITRTGDYLKWDANLDTINLFWRKLEQRLHYQCHERPRFIPNSQMFSINQSDEH